MEPNQPTLTRGEKIALASGKSINTEAQYALMYLVQTGKTGTLPQPYNKTNEQDLYFYAGLSPETGRNTGAQIKAYIMDDIDSTHQLGNNKKGVTFVQKFQEMPIEQVAQIAAEGFDANNFEDLKNKYTDKKANQTAKTVGKVPSNLFTPEQLKTLKSFGPGQEEERKAYLQSIKTEAFKLNQTIKMLESQTGKKVILK